MKKPKKFRRCKDNDDNVYLIPEDKADRFEELIGIEREMGMQASEVLTKELAKFDTYLVEEKHG